MVSLGQELEKGLARQFWFNVPWVNAVTGWLELEEQEHRTSGNGPDLFLLSYSLGTFPCGLCGWDGVGFLIALQSQNSQTVYTVTEGSKTKCASSRGTDYIVFWCFFLPTLEVKFLASLPCILWSKQL